VSGTQDYELRLECDGAEMAGECSCPQGADGAFCKHCVATALAWIDDGDGAPNEPVQIVRVTAVECPEP